MAVRRFLLVSLSINTILEEVTIRQRRKKLEEVTQGNGLSDAYTATLTRLRAQRGYKSALGLKVLMWVLHSERPLRAEELCHALRVETRSVDLDPQNVPTLQTLLSSCLGLVTVEPSSSTVRLAHFTLHEYLSSDPNLFHSPHSTIAEVCLTYLNFRHVWDIVPTVDPAPPTMPLLEYASCYWGEHTMKGVTEDVKALALRLLGRFDEHISARLMLLHYNDKLYGPYFYGIEGATRFTGLHTVAFLGISAIVSPLLQIRDGMLMQETVRGGTALTWAARNGHEGVVETLLEREDVNPDQADAEFGRTPLSWAAGSGHDGVVKTLLEREDVNPNCADIKYSRTPLSLAAERGHEGVVKTLLEREDINTDQADAEFGRTPLSWAAGGGHERVVKTLLGRGDVGPHRADTKYGRTPLLWAAGNGHEGIVKSVLKQEDVDLNAVDSSGRTPLSWAAGNGHEGVVKVFLERKDITPNLADSSGRTPLLWATSKKDERVAQLLLEHQCFVPNQAHTNELPPASLRIAINLCFFITALYFLSYLLTIA